MADNVQVTQGSGTTMATDEIGGVHYPRVKLSIGGDGAASDVSAQSPLPVSMAGNDDLATETTLALVATEETLLKVATEETLLKVATEDTLSGLSSTLASEATLSSIESKIPSSRQPSLARQLAAGATSANTALTVTAREVTMRAVGADIRYEVGSTGQTASATSHFIAQNERLRIAVPSTPNIAVIRNASTDGTLELSELV